MPEAIIRKRGGAKRYRSVKKNGKTLTCAVVPKAGPRGGHAVCWSRGHKY